MSNVSAKAVRDRVWQFLTPAPHWASEGGHRMNEPVDGVSVLRQALRARNKTPNMLSLIASEIDGVGVSTLEDFSNNKANLGIETLQILTQTRQVGCFLGLDRFLVQRNFDTIGQFRQLVRSRAKQKTVIERDH